VAKGHKGFTLTPEEAADGISAEEFMRGLVVDEDARTFEWRESLPVRTICTFPTPIPISFISSPGVDAGSPDPRFYGGSPTSRGSPGGCSGSGPSSSNTKTPLPHLCF
jgi:hypothetical protein